MLIRESSLKCVYKKDEISSSLISANRSNILNVALQQQIIIISKSIIEIQFISFKSNMSNKTYFINKKIVSVFNILHLILSSKFASAKMASPLNNSSASI